MEDIYTVLYAENAYKIKFIVRWKKMFTNALIVIM